MRHLIAGILPLLASIAGCAGDPGSPSQWTQRDERWQPRGPWKWSVRDRQPELWVEFNGIDFGHAHLAETLLETQDQGEVERARLDVLDFIFSAPVVPPDEDQVSPDFVRLVWEVQKTFNWTHVFHRSLYDLFASDVEDKDQVYRQLLADYLDKPEALTSHPLDLHGKLWGFPESKTFRNKFPKFNTQIWAYHWLQAASYDVQLASQNDPARQRDLFRPVIAFYHGYLRRPPIEWKMMPMLEEGSPEFSRRFPEAARIFNNLHMIHDNVDDVLSSPERYPTPADKRRAILRILEIYLNRNHEPEDRFAEYHTEPHPPEHAIEMMKKMGPRPPTAREVFEGRVPVFSSERAPMNREPKPEHEGHVK